MVKQIIDGILISDRVTGVGDDEKLILSSDGLTYLIYNSSLDRVEIWKGGSLKAAW